MTLANEVAVNAASSHGAVAVSASGLVAYRTGGAGQRQLTWFDRTGQALGTLGAPDDNLWFPRVSPDGRRVVVGPTVQGNTGLWVCSLGARHQSGTVEKGLTGLAPRRHSLTAYTAVS